MAKAKVTVATIEKNILQLQTMEKLLSDLGSAKDNQSVPESIRVTLAATFSANKKIHEETLARAIRQMLPKVEGAELSDVTKLWETMKPFWMTAESK